MNISNKKEKMIIVGPSGSGKDFLMRKMVEKGLRPCIKWTTRPMRKMEVQGVNYNFVSNDHFLSAINNNDMLVYQKFIVTPDNKKEEEWLYGITKEDFKNSQVVILTPGEFNSMNIKYKERNRLFVVYLDIPRNIRESRLFIREDKNDSIKRRLDSDELDFKEFNDYDLRINDSEFDSEDIYNLMD